MWWAIFEIATGRLVSLTSTKPGLLPVGMASVEVGNEQPGPRVVWDEVTKAFVPRPAKVTVDRIQELRDDANLATAWSRLTVAQRQALIDRLTALLGPYRFRAQGESTNLQATRG